MPTEKAAKQQPLLLFESLEHVLHFKSLEKFEEIARDPEKDFYAQYQAFSSTLYNEIRVDPPSLWLIHIGFYNREEDNVLCDIRGQINPNLQWPSRDNFTEDLVKFNLGDIGNTHWTSEISYLPGLELRLPFKSAYALTYPSESEDPNTNPKTNPLKFLIAVVFMKQQIIKTLTCLPESFALFKKTCKEIAKHKAAEDLADTPKRVASSQLEIETPTLERGVQQNLSRQSSETLRCDFGSTTGEIGDDTCEDLYEKPEKVLLENLVNSKKRFAQSLLDNREIKRVAAAPHTLPDGRHEGITTHETATLLPTEKDAAVLSNFIQSFDGFQAFLQQTDFFEGVQNLRNVKQKYENYPQYYQDAHTRLTLEEKNASLQAIMSKQDTKIKELEEQLTLMITRLEKTETENKRGKERLKKAELIFQEHKNDEEDITRILERHREWSAF